MDGSTYISVRSAWAAFLIVTCSLVAGAAETAADFTLQTRDRETRRTVIRKEAINLSKIGIVIIDMWNTNDCMTNAQRAAALVPRMNKVLDAARRLGMQIIWAPTDVVNYYAGTAQRERVLACRALPCRISPIFPAHSAFPLCGRKSACVDRASYATFTTAGTRWIRTS